VLKFWERSSGTKPTAKGYRVLRRMVRVIQGDGVNMFTVQNMLYQLAKFHGWSADNIAFGNGGRAAAATEP